ncbi:MAG: VOC family protein [Bdellovibrionales bacterium]|nr:VOC family protein [Bdellovibrionales bacterium]
MIVHTILYVADQDRSTNFYKQVLGEEPQLHVPGMTEFKLSENHILGLMPEKGIKKLLGSKIPDSFAASGVPRAELYIRIQDPKKMFDAALRFGAKELDPIKPRDWGGCAGYVMDHDGHVLAFAT